MRYFLFICLLFIACSPKTEKKEIVKEKQLVILPIAQVTDKAYSQKIHPEISLPPLYIGENTNNIDQRKLVIRDTNWISVNRSDSMMFVKLRFMGSEKHIWGYENCYFPSDSLTIKVDTSSRTVCDLRYEKSYGYYLPATVSAYPVIIRNTSHDSLIFQILNPIIQAKDQSGKWQEVSRFRLMIDYTGEPCYFILPGEMMISTVPIYEGSFPTVFRLGLAEYENIYSNEYPGTINPKNFR